MDNAFAFATKNETRSQRCCPMCIVHMSSHCAKKCEAHFALQCDSRLALEHYVGSVHDQTGDDSLNLCWVVRGQL